MLDGGEAAGALAGRHVLVTAGPTYEAIDPVRFIGNRSSGLQGYAIARAAQRAGAQVTLVSGPVALAKPEGVSVVNVESAREMLAAVEAALPADVFIGAAAVADWRVEAAKTQKLKKTKDSTPTLSWWRIRIFSQVWRQRKHARPGLVVGFAAETEHVLLYAQEKLARKACDYIVANAIGGQGEVFGAPDNEVHIVTRENVISWPKMSKDMVAQRLIDFLAERLGSGK